MEAAVSILVPTADIQRRPVELESLPQILKKLCQCADWAVELAGKSNSPEAATFANTVYTRACNYARGLGYRLRFTQNGFVAVEMEAEPESERARR